MAGNRRGKRRRLRAALIIGFIVVVAVAAFLVYRGVKDDSAAQVSYTTAPVQRMTLTSSVSGTGNVELSQSVAVQPGVSGTVSGLTVKVGDTVEAGQLLFTIVNPELDLAVTQAEIAYQEALLNLEKAKLNVQQAEEDLAEVQEQYEAQSTTTTARATTSIPASTTTSVLPASTTTSAPSASSTTSTVSSTTTTTALSTEDSNSTTTTSTGPPEASVELVIPASAAESTASQSGSTSGSSATAGSSGNSKITYLDIKAAKQAVESAELGVTSAKAQVTSAELALEEAKENAAKREVRAPISGIVTALDVENGDTVGQSSLSSGGGGSATTGSSAGSSDSSGGVLTITDPDAFTITVALPESDISVVEIGQKATIMFDALPDLTLTGKVTSIDMAGTNNQGVVSYGVVVTPDLTDPSVKAGMTVSVDIITAVAVDVLAVPSAAVKSQGDTKYVQVLENETPVSVTVETGMSTDSYVEITSGLTEGQEVIVQAITADSGATATTAFNRTGSVFDGGGAVPGGAMPGGFVR